MRISMVLLTLLCSGAPAAAQMLELELPANDLVYDTVRQRIYVSVPSRAGGSLGNTITAIDPATGAIGPSVFVGSEPGKLALSGDGRFLYVALDGAAAVRRVDAATLTPGLQFALGNDPHFGPYYVEDMEVLPGASGSVAVSRRRAGVSPQHGGVAVYDDGVRRPDVADDHTGSNVIEFSSTAARLYGLNTETTEFGFRRMDVTASGVSVLDVTPGVVSMFNQDIVFDGGRVYFSGGHVFDPEERQPAGTFPLPFASMTVVRPAVDVGRVYFLTDHTLRVFDAHTFVPIDEVPIAGMEGDPVSFIRVGAAGLAFNTSEDQVFLLGNLLGSQVPTLTLGLTGCTAACRAGDILRVSATVGNPGAQPLRVEVKAGVVMPGGATMNVWTGGNAHFETTLPPGLNVAVELLSVAVPAGLPPGGWLYEAALITPDLGRTLWRDVKAFTVTP